MKKITFFLCLVCMMFCSRHQPPTNKQVIDSFLKINENLVITNINLTKQTEGLYEVFDKQYAINKAKVEPFWQRAKQADSMTKDLINYIINVRSTVISKATGIDVSEADTINPWNLSSPDEYSKSTDYLIGNKNDGSAGEGHIMKTRIIEYKKNMINLLDPRSRRQIEKGFGLSVEIPYYIRKTNPRTWEIYCFNNTILVGDIVILNKLINEIKNAEFNVVSQLFAAITETDFKFDNIGVRVIPKSTYVLPGQNFEADIVVAAFDT
jgi:hypothetical protein